MLSNCDPADSITSDNKQLYKTLEDKPMEQINEPSEIPQRLKTFYCLSLCNRISGFILVTLIITWILQYRGGFFASNFNWHPLFMILGMVFFFSRGMLFYRTERTIGMHRLKVMYARLMIGCLIFTITGLVAGFEQNVVAESMESHRSTFGMFTLHTWVGLISVILFFSQSVTDFYAHLYNPVINKPLITIYMQRYNCVTVITFVAATASCLLGFHELTNFRANHRIDSESSENTLLCFTYLTLITFGGLSLYLFSCDSYKRLRRPEDDDLITKTAFFKHLFCIPWSLNECTYSVRIFSRNHSLPPLRVAVDT